MTKKQKKRKKKIIRTISTLFLILAIILLNYPTGTDIVNAIKTSKLHSQYTENTKSLNLDKIEQEVEIYNQKLLTKNDRLTTEKESSEYEQLMNVHNGTICYLNCENAGIIDVPVYHNTTTEILQVGAGHLCGTSFPSDKQGVNIAISGHSGMAGMKMFSLLPKLVTGDTFSISYLNKTLVYTIDKITTTLPNDTTHLAIDPAQNYCTLITCTPIGVNTHRLIVRGVLTDVQLGVTSTSGSKGFSFKTLMRRFATYELVMSGISLIFVAFLISDIVTACKKNKKKKKKIKSQRKKAIVNEKC